MTTRTSHWNWSIRHHHHHHQQQQQQQQQKLRLQYWLLLCLLLLSLPCISLARPLVRNIQSTHEWDRLLHKHAHETGLPVVVDFYSDSCGPCRMMAPIFQKVAKQYLDQAVFVKVDTNAQYELSSRYQIRSLPTFQFFLGGKKVHQAVGGIGEQGLQQEVSSLVRQAQAENVMIELDALVDYYKTVDATKSASDIQSVYQKCVDMIKSNTAKKCVGAPATQLAKKLKKKYKTAPKLVPRFTDEDRKPKSSGAAAAKEKPSKNKKSGAEPEQQQQQQANLHLASKEELQAELERRLDEERDAQVEREDALEMEMDPEYHSWTPSGYPEKLVIVGGGPAGWSAAIYGARAGLKPLVIAPTMGGQLQGKGVDVENYPGLMSQQGPALVAAMRQQAIHFGATVEDDIVTAIRQSPRLTSNNNQGVAPLTIVTNATGEIQAHSVVVATGAESIWLNVPGEWELRGGGVSSCATCDGFLFANKEVIVVGGGDAAMEDALVLARTSRKVTVLHRRHTFKASKVLANRVLNHPVIQVQWNTTVQEILGKELESNDSDDDDDEQDLDQPRQKVVRAVVVKNVATGETRQLDCDAVFVAIGHKPSTSFLQGSGVEFHESLPGYVRTLPGSTATTVKGIFAAGDVADAVYRQAITSAGSGAAAALDAERYLSEYGLGTEQDDLEAELMAELRLSSRSGAAGDRHAAPNKAHGGDDDDDDDDDDESVPYYNVYEDLDAAATRKQFARESIKMDL